MKLALSDTGKSNDFGNLFRQAVRMWCSDWI